MIFHRFFVFFSCFLTWFLTCHFAYTAVYLWYLYQNLSKMRSVFCHHFSWFFIIFSHFSDLSVCHSLLPLTSNTCMSLVRWSLGTSKNSHFSSIFHAFWPVLKPFWTSFWCLCMLISQNIIICVFFHVFAVFCIFHHFSSIFDMFLMLFLSQLY